MEKERAFGLPVMISPGIKIATPNQIIPCRTKFLPASETPTSTRGVFHVTPRTPLSFPIGIKAVFNEEVASIRIPNNTPVDHLERILSTRWGVPVKLADGEPTMWLPNKEDRFVSVRPGEKAAMTEAMIEANAQPTELELLVIVCDGAQKYPQTVRVK
jgi:hypothetical protein